MSDEPEDADLDEGEMAIEVGNLLWNYLEQMGWKSVDGYDLGEVEIVTNSGITYRLIVTIADPAGA